ncbi:hypothetical protein [Mesobacillus subterraneus]|uniref:Uncharacterized protein n=1 Tax=Mesobacillus subterraneus TaxID=285983 RepID=A0A3R9FUQ0_9BACI|nr:hypothetical protein [Mesobacillus subterraneus]RSD25522.1 hypothetical protein EJA10_17100 [Mesobacillus subterraneus]
MLLNLFRLGMVVLSWSSFLLYPKRSFKRFLPVTIFVTALVSILLILSKPFRLWKVTGGLGSKLVNDLGFTLGPFFAANMWVFKLAYGNIWQYLGINLVIDYILAFPLSTIFRKLDIYRLDRLRPKYFFVIIYSFAIMAYAFQYFFKEPKRSKFFSF